MTDQQIIETAQIGGPSTVEQFYMWRRALRRNDLTNAAVADTLLEFSRFMGDPPALVDIISELRNLSPQDRASDVSLLLFFDISENSYRLSQLGVGNQTASSELTATEVKSLLARALDGFALRRSSLEQDRVTARKEYETAQDRLRKIEFHLGVLQG